jgi:hypothetical protein
VPAPFEDVCHSDHVAVYVGERILDRVTHTGLRTEVDNPFELLVREQLPIPARSADRAS